MTDKNILAHSAMWPYAICLDLKKIERPVGFDVFVKVRCYRN